MLRYKGICQVEGFFLGLTAEAFLSILVLAKKKLVSYRYRQVTPLDVPGLEETVCECYATIRGKAQELLT